jgi:ubiquinone/menaquinone biosynthesis C-methylase UbiE
MTDSDSGDRKRQTADSFGVAAEAYLDSDVHRKGDDLDTLASWCAGATRALDVATGAGHTAGAVAATGVPRTVAADASPDMVATTVAEFGGVEGVVADAERLPFSSDSFDAATCRIAAHHFPDPEAFVDEVARVVEPGGTFAFEDNVAPEDEALGEFINRVEGLRDTTHVESYATSQWHEWLTDAGFEVEETLHLKKTLEFDPWTAAQSLSEETYREVEDVLLNASAEASAFFEVDVVDGSVESFANLKTLIRATRAE